MSKKLKMTTLFAVLMVILVLAIGLVACNPKTNTYKVTTQFNAEQGDVVLAPEAKDGNYEEGTEITVSVTAKSGYEFDALTVNTDANAALNNEGKYIFKVTADTQITVLFRSVAPAACEHKNLSALVEGKAATCMEAGVIAHYHCNDCGKDLAEEKTTVLDSTEIAINPNAHDFDVWVAEVPATCSATGTAAHKDCKLCHKHFDNDGKEIAANKYTLAIDSRAHKYGAMQDLKPATCSATGIKAHKDCELCHKHFSEQNVEIPDNELTIPATGQHKYDKLVNVNDKNGHEVHCSVCDAKQSETLTPHTYGTEYVQDGVQGHHQECACGYKTETKAHEKGNNPYTDYEGETHSFECEKCGRKVTDEHSYGTWQIDGEGKHYRACVCGKETAHGEHNFGDSPVYTDSKDGTHHTVKCTVCEIDVEQEHTPRLVSDEESGHHTECTLCTYKSETTKHNLKYEQIDAVEQKDGSIVTPDTAGAAGGQVKAHREICDCGYKTQLTECTLEYEKNEQGHWQKCSVCDISPTKGEKTGHTIKAMFDNKDEGYHWQGCTCGYVQGEKVKHSFDENQYKELTKTLHYTPCKGCEYVGHNQGQHTYDEGKYQPTPNDEKNTHQQICDKCDHVNATAQSEEHEWDKEVHKDGAYEYHICTKCGQESERTQSKEHVHKWTVTEEGWYEGDGICEGGDECTESIFTISEDGSTITGLTDNLGEITKVKFPNIIGGKNVTAIGDSEANNQTKAFAKLVGIKFSDGITTINKYCFCGSKFAEGCGDIILPDSIIDVGTGAFRESNLTSIKCNFSSTNSQIFYKCTSLISAHFGSNTTGLASSEFNGCSALKELVFESNQMIDIAANALKGVSKTEIKIYFKISKDTYNSGKVLDTELTEANFYFYYDENPYEGGDILGTSGAWHYSKSGDIEVWPKH